MPRFLGFGDRTAKTTVGSRNLHRFSLFGNGEINPAFSEPNIIRAFRRDLFRKHLDQDTLDLDDRRAFHVFRTMARANRKKFEVGDAAWQGLAFELDLAAYVG
jgi:cardiolipin synthase